MDIQQTEIEVKPETFAAHCQWCEGCPGCWPMDAHVIEHQEMEIDSDEHWRMDVGA